MVKVRILCKMQLNIHRKSTRAGLLPETGRELPRGSGINSFVVFNKTMLGRALGLLLAGPALFALHAEDGLWLWNQLPRPVAGAKRSLEITPALADHLRLATVRLNDGAGSGSFVSANGLLLTNQHLVASCLAVPSATDGFYTASQSTEKACPGLHADVLVKLEDVTTQVKGAAAVKADETAKGLAKELAASPQVLRERNVNIAKIEQASVRGEGRPVMFLQEGAAWCGFFPGAAMTSINTGDTPIFVWYLRPSVRSRFSGVSATAFPICAMAWMLRFFGPGRTAILLQHRIFFRGATRP